MNLVFENSLSMVVSILNSLTSQLFPFVDKVIEFVTIPVYSLIENLVTSFPLGDFFGAPFLLLCRFLFPDDVTILGFVFGVGIGVYLLWNVTKWIAEMITGYKFPHIPS